MEWENFKKLIKIMRKEQDNLIKTQNGFTDVMFEVSVLDGGNDYISFHPHDINLKTGHVFARNSNGYDKYNVKEILKWREEERNKNEI